MDRREVRLRRTAIATPVSVNCNERWRSKLEVVLRQEHTAPEKMFVDWAASTIPVYDRLTGQGRAASGTHKLSENKALQINSTGAMKHPADQHIGGKVLHAMKKNATKKKRHRPNR